MLIGEDVSNVVMVMSVVSVKKVGLVDRVSV